MVLDFVLGRGTSAGLVRVGFCGGDHWWVSARRHRRQHVFLAHNERGSVVAGQLETMPVRDGIGWARLDAIPAKDTAVVIDVVNLGVALSTGNPSGLGILRGFDVNAVGGARGGAQKTGHTLLQAVFITLEHV